MWLMVHFNGETEVLHVALFVLDYHVSYYAANELYPCAFLRVNKHFENVRLIKARAVIVPVAADPDLTV